MTVQIVTTKVSVGVKPGDTEETYVHNGAMVPEWVDPYTLFVLTSTGMGRVVSDPGAEPLELADVGSAVPVLLPEHLPPKAGTYEAEVELERARTEGMDFARGGFPTGSEGDELVADDGSGGPAAGPEGSADEPPARSASKAEWVDYAVSQGADRGEAEAMTQKELVATYGR